MSSRDSSAPDVGLLTADKAVQAAADGVFLVLTAPVPLGALRDRASCGCIGPA